MQSMQARSVKVMQPRQWVMQGYAGVCRLHSMQVMQWICSAYAVYAVCITHLHKHNHLTGYAASAASAAGALVHAAGACPMHYVSYKR